jgi:hypothetical protein
MPNNMAKPADSTDSAALELQSLQREVNKNEFFDFLRTEQANFLNMRTLQASKIILLFFFFATAADKILQNSCARSADLTNTPREGSCTPQSPPSNSQPPPQAAAIGKTALHDFTGQEINMEETPKIRYRHPS